MEAVQLSLFEYQQAESERGFSPICYLAKAWWDNIVHAALSFITFWITLFAIVIATSFGVADVRQSQRMESILEQRRRRARREGKRIYLIGIGDVNGQLTTLKDTIK